MFNTIGDACNITTGKLNANAAVPSGKYPFFTCAENPDSIDNYVFDADVVLIAGNNAQGNFHVNRFAGKFNAYQRTYVLTAKPEHDIDYIYYALKLELKRLKERSQGSQTKFLTMPILTDIQFQKLDYDQQKKVSGVLKFIDKKIELNNSINAELEAMAKTLYDYWFVQFDFPFDFATGKTDPNGKPYKSSGGKTVYNSTLKREIPEGWEGRTLSKITVVSNDSINPADQPEKQFKHFSIPVFDVKKTSRVELGNTIGSNKFIVGKDDLLVSKLNPWFNRVAYVMDEEDQICSTEFVVWRNADPAIKNFLYLTATSPQFTGHCTQSATGTSNSHKRVNPSVMMGFTIPYQNDVATMFGDRLDSTIKQLMINQKENGRLAVLRDWLLPMLMNGQVTIKP